MSLEWQQLRFCSCDATRTPPLTRDTVSREGLAISVRRPGISCNGEAECPPCGSAAFRLPCRGALNRRPQQRPAQQLCGALPPPVEPTGLLISVGLAEVAPFTAAQLPFTNPMAAPVSLAGDSTTCSPPQLPVGVSNARGFADAHDALGRRAVVFLWYSCTLSNPVWPSAHAGVLRCAGAAVVCARRRLLSRTKLGMASGRL